MLAMATYPKERTERQVTCDLSAGDRRRALRLRVSTHTRGLGAKGRALVGNATSLSPHPVSGSHALLIALILMLVIAVATASVQAATAHAATFDPEQAQTVAAESRARMLWWSFDGPLWDISDEGLPFLVTLALPSERDPITRWLLGVENRWTASLGYARVYDSHDPTSGDLRSRGGDAALFSVGRQAFWELPPLIGRFTPRLELELGAAYATHSFPADGTALTFKIVTGFEWRWGARNERDAEWFMGIRWLHFSNANLQSNNAGYDGLVVRIGRQVRF